MATARCQSPREFFAWPGPLTNRFRLAELKASWSCLAWRSRLGQLGPLCLDYYPALKASQKRLCWTAAGHVSHYRFRGPAPFDRAPGRARHVSPLHRRLLRTRSRLHHGLHGFLASAATHSQTSSIARIAWLARQPLGRQSGGKQAATPSCR